MYSSVGAGGNANSWGVPNYSANGRNNKDYSRVSAFEMDEGRGGGRSGNRRARMSNFLGDKAGWKRGAMVALGALVFVFVILGRTGNKTDSALDSYNSNSYNYNNEYAEYPSEDTSSVTYPNTNTNTNANSAYNPGLRGNPNHDNYHQEGHDAYFHHGEQKPLWQNHNNNNQNANDQDINNPYSIYGKEASEEAKQPLLDKTEDELPERQTLAPEMEEELEEEEEKVEAEVQQEEQTEEEAQDEPKELTPEEIEDCVKNPSTELHQICEGNNDEECLRKGCTHGMSHAAQHFIDQQNCRQEPSPDIKDLCDLLEDSAEQEACIMVACQKGIQVATEQFDVPEVIGMTEQELDQCTSNPTPEIIAACEDKQNLEDKYYYQFPWYHSCLEMACIKGTEEAETYASGNGGCAPRVPYVIKSLCQPIGFKDKENCIQAACTNGYEAGQEYVTNYHQETYSNNAANNSTSLDDSQPASNVTDIDTTDLDTTDSGSDVAPGPQDTSPSELCRLHPLAEVKRICQPAINMEACLKAGCKGPNAARLYMQQEENQSDATAAEIAEGLDETTESEQVFDPNTGENETLTVTRASPSSSIDDDGNDHSEEDNGTWPSYHGCETAYAYDPINGICFMKNENIDKWGWSMCLSPGTYSFEIYTGAVNCDITKGNKVGNFEFYWDGEVSGYASYTADNFYGFKQTHFNIEADPLPADEAGDKTIDPKFYTIAHDVVENPKNDHITLSDLSANDSNQLCIIAQAVSCQGDEYKDVEELDSGNDGSSAAETGENQSVVPEEKVVICHGSNDDDAPYVKASLDPQHVALHLSGPHNKEKKYHDGYPGEEVDVEGTMYRLSEDCELILVAAEEEVEQNSLVVDGEDTASPEGEGNIPLAIENPADPEGDAQTTPPVHDLLLPPPPSLPTGQENKEGQEGLEPTEEVEEQEENNKVTEKPVDDEDGVDGTEFDEYSGEGGTEPNMLGDTGYNPIDGPSKNEEGDEMELKIVEPSLDNDEDDTDSPEWVEEEMKEGMWQDENAPDWIDEEKEEEMWEEMEGEDEDWEGGDDNYDDIYPEVELGGSAVEQGYDDDDDDEAYADDDNNEGDDNYDDEFTEADDDTE